MTPLLDILRSPCCHAPLTATAQAGASCTTCQMAYLRESYGLNLMPVDFAALQPALIQWRAVQDALARWRQRTWTGSQDAQARSRENARMVDAFLAFAGVAGRVLDVGCGNGWIRTAIEERGGVYAGIDPAPAGTAYDFPFYRALSDVMPFRSESFDALVFLSSLDYSLNLAATLKEAARVLVPGGTIAIATPIHASRETDGERLHHHRFLAGELEAALGRHFLAPETMAWRDNYHFIQARRRTES